jgi:hypothetical protein
VSPSAENLKADGAYIKNPTQITMTNSLILVVIGFPSFLSLVERMRRFILQCGEASANDALKLRMFPLSLSRTAFNWFTSLTPNSIFT